VSHRFRHPSVWYTRCTFRLCYLKSQCAVYGIDANLIDVEVDYSGAVTEKDIFSYGRLARCRRAREPRPRRAAIKTPATPFRPRSSLSPSPRRPEKEGSGFDLPIAVGILGAYGALRVTDLSQFLLVGELGLDGNLRPIPGMLPVAIFAREKKYPESDSSSRQCSRSCRCGRSERLSCFLSDDVLDLLNSSVVGVIQREPYRVNTQELAGRVAALQRGL